MNCKPGDLAMVIGGISGSEIGKIVTCERIASLSEFEFTPRTQPVWKVDRDMSWKTPSGMIRIPYIPDKFLMPINPLNDETTDETKEKNIHA